MSHRQGCWCDACTIRELRTEVERLKTLHVKQLSEVVERMADDHCVVVERLRGLWRPITDAPQFNNTPALVGQYSEGYGWRKVSLWDVGWTRDECIKRGATHWMPHLRDLPIPAALAGEKP